MPLFLRRGQPKAGIDWRDLAMLLLVFSGTERGAGRGERSATVDEGLRGCGKDLG
jgi:hypothetical protein